MLGIWNAVVASLLELGIDGWQGLWPLTFATITSCSCEYQHFGHFLALDITSQAAKLPTAQTAKYRWL